MTRQRDEPAGSVHRCAGRRWMAYGRPLATTMDPEDLKFAVVALSAVFFVMDPVANVPIFLTITASDTPEVRRQIARRAALATWLLLSVFALAGGLIFKVFGISLGAFKIAGGLMLLLMAIDMMRAQPPRT